MVTKSVKERGKTGAGAGHTHTCRSQGLQPQSCPHVCVYTYMRREEQALTITALFAQPEPPSQTVQPSLA